MAASRPLDGNVYGQGYLLTEAHQRLLSRILSLALRVNPKETIEFMETQITEMKGSSTLIIISSLLIDFLDPFSGLGVELAS